MHPNKKLLRGGRYGLVDKFRPLLCQNSFFFVRFSSIIRTRENAQKINMTAQQKKFLCDKTLEPFCTYNI